MKKALNYIGYSVRSILSNRMYATFYIFGTAVAFILILLLLSAIRLIGGGTRPFVNSENMIRVSPQYYDIRDEWVGGIATQDIGPFVESLPGAVDYSIGNLQYTIAFAGSKVRSAAVSFVDHKYFEINDEL